MNSDLYQKKFLITLLTSSNSKLLKLVYNTIINQKNNYLNYTIIIVVNSLNIEYYQEVCNEFKEINVEIIETKSNGKPGMGHNSLFTIFKNNKQYDYLIPIDGDDFLYPYALHQLTKAIDKYNPDILVLQGNDLLSYYNDSTSSTDIYLNNCFYLIKQDEYPDNKWKYNNKSLNINPFEKDYFITPIRLILCSRNIFNLNIDKYYCEESNIIDDYLFYLHFINIYINKLLNVFIINSAHIYLYNDLSITSVHKTLDLSSDYNHIRSYEYLFSDIKNFYNNKWDVLKLPFKYIEPPFDAKFTNYKIENNNIQIIDYCEYLDNINTKYIIEFSNNLVLKIYNIFKSNIDQWLCSNNIKAFELCSTLIENNISDRDIFTYICIYGVLNRKLDIVYKYIKDAYPISKNYSCLLKYI